MKNVDAAARGSRGAKFRVSLDVALVAALVALMPYGNLPKTLHECVGVLFFALAILHVAINRGWFKTIFRGVFTPLKTYRAALVASIGVVVVLQAVSGILLSSQLFPFIPSEGCSEDARSVHLILGAWILLLAGLHLGAHWLRLARRASGRPALKLALAIGSLLLIMRGGYAFYQRGTLDLLTAKTQFPFFDGDESPAFALFDYFAIFWLYVVVGAILFSVLQYLSFVPASEDFESRADFIPPTVGDKNESNDKD